MTLHAYLPQDRLHALARGETLPDRASGSVLFADISGFTALTESLHDSLGSRLGGEQLSKFLDVVYGILIFELENFGGSVISFAGDALLCWFDDSQGTAANRAVASAFAIQDEMRGFHETALPNSLIAYLSLKVTVASGVIRRFIVGDPNIQQMDILAGSAVARTSTAELLAKKNEVLVDGETAKTLGESLTIREWREDKESKERFAVVLSYASEVAISVPESIHSLDKDKLRKWIHPRLLDREVSQQGTFLTEIRPCVALFVRFMGINYDSDSAESALDAFIQQVQNAATRYEGTLMDITIGDKGSYAYVNFGALSVHEDDARRAVKTALELKDISSLSLQFGITKGLMRVGAYGGTTRKVFGALGNDVNLAARLMTIVDPGEILVSGRVHKMIRNDFTIEPHPPLHMKGRTEPIPVFAVTGERQKRAIRLQEPDYALPMVGRQNELQQIIEKLQLVQQGKSKIIGIIAEAGMGKSRLVAEVIRRARKMGFVGYGGACQSDAVNIPYYAWKGIWNAFFDIDPAAPLRKNLRNLEVEVEELAPDRMHALPLLSSVLDIEIPENEFTKKIEPKYRQSALRALLEDCLRGTAKATPLLIVIEDLHWLDALSHDLLEELAKALTDNCICFVMVYRPPKILRLQAPQLETRSNFTRIELPELTQSEVEQAIRAKLAQLYPARHDALPPDLVEKLMERTQGNPFYLEELLNFLRDRGLDPRDPADLAKIELPESLHTLILSRIDRLTDHEKTTLRVASIIGRLFRAAWLTGYYPDLGGLPNVKSDLDQLAKMDITPLEIPEPELAYLFKHIITHEVTYESLPFTTRVRLHEQLARFLENTDAPVGTIAFHYGRSENKEKQREYLRKAGEAAQKSFANDAALEYYGALLPLLKDAKEQAQIYLRRGEVLRLIGKWDDAESDYRAALKSARDDLTLQASAYVALGKLDRLRGNYDPAFEWLGQAKEAHSKLEDTAGLAQVLIETGIVLWRKSEYEQAREPLNEGLALAREGGDKLNTALALNNLGYVAYRQGDYAGARALYEESLALAREMDDKISIAGSLTSLGNMAYRQSNFAGAQALYEESLALAREMGDKWGTAVTLFNLGNVLWMQSDYDSGRASYEESLALAREMGDKDVIAGSLHNLGNVAQSQGDNAVAKMLYEESLVLNREMGDKRGIAGSLDSLGRIAQAQGNYAEARALQEESLALYREIGDKRGISNSLNNLAVVAQAQGNHTEAREIFEESLALSKEMDAKTRVAYALLGLGLVDLVEDKPEAREHVLQSLRPRVETGEQLQQTSSLIGVAGLALQKGDPQFAAQLFGAVETALKVLNAMVEVDVKFFYEQTLAKTKEALGEAAFRSAWEEGSQWTLEEAVKKVFEEYHE